MLSRIDNFIADTRKRCRSDTGKKKKTTALNHYLDYRERRGLPPLTTDPLNPEAQLENMRYMGYECGEHGLKGASLGSKLSEINKYHVDHFLPEPFKTQILVNFAEELRANDKAAVPKIPCPPQVVELQDLEYNKGDFDELVMTTAQSVALHWTLRSCEYVGTEKFDYANGLLWKHIYFKDSAGKKLEKENAKDCAKVTASIKSTKNAFGRCTRTLYRNDKNKSVLSPSWKSCSSGGLMKQVRGRIQTPPFSCCVRGRC